MQRTIGTQEARPEVTPDRPRAPTLPEAGASPPESAATRLGDVLMNAAQLAVDQSMELSTFMNLAWLAYVEARPGYREELEQQQLLRDMAELRELGRVGQA
jgi:hypothetical protein